MKMKVGLSLEEITVKRIDVLAAGTRRDKSAIVDMAVELLAQQEEFSNLNPPTPPKNKGASRPARRHPFDPTEVKGVRKGMPLAAEVS